MYGGCAMRFSNFPLVYTHTHGSFLRALTSRWKFSPEYIIARKAQPEIVVVRDVCYFKYKVVTLDIAF